MGESMLIWKIPAIPKESPWEKIAGMTLNFRLSKVSSESKSSYLLLKVLCTSTKNMMVQERLNQSSKYL